jgi:hypothetical protein
MSLSKAAILFTSLLTILFALGTSKAQAPSEADPTTYLFYPNSPLHLGGGLSPNDLSKTNVDCFDYKTYAVDGDDGKATLGTQFSKTLVTTTSQLKSALSLDTKIDASYLAFKGGASFSYNSSSMFSDDSLTVVLAATTLYSRRSVHLANNGHLGLNEVGQKWISDGDGFAENCGTRFVNFEHDASVTYIIITISAVSSQDKKDIVSQLSAQGGWGPLSVGASAKFNSQLASSTGQNRIDIQVVATGGSGLDSLGKLLKNLDNKGNINSIESIENAMGEYLTTFNAQNAAPFSFDVTSMSFAGWKAESAALWTNNQQRILE